jgi:hypothetical protein
MPFGGPPNAPDYRGAAEAQGASSAANIEQQTRANRPNMNTPWGSMQWTEGPGGMWSGNLSLSPDQQTALDSQMRLGRERSGLAEGMMGQVKDAFSNPMDWGALGDMPNVETARGEAINATMDRYKSRLDPMWQQREDQQRSQLLGQGFTEGSEAYNKAMGDFSRGRNDAYQQAMDQSVNMGEGAAQGTWQRGMGNRQQSISEMLSKRAQPLNEMQALMTGQQVGMPQMPSFNAAGAANPTQYLGAAQAQGDYQMQAWQQQQKMWGDIFGGAGGMASSAIPFMFL